MRKFSCSFLEQHLLAEVSQEEGPVCMVVSSSLFPVPMSALCRQKALNGEVMISFKNVKGMIRDSLRVGGGAGVVLSSSSSGSQHSSNHSTSTLFWTTFSMPDTALCPPSAP